MKIVKTRNAATLVLALEGRLDTLTAPQLEAELNAGLDGVTHLVLDFAKLEYVSSAGLRVLLATWKRMDGRGKMEVTQVGEGVMEVLEMTGFSDILTIVPPQT